MTTTRDTGARIVRGAAGRTGVRRAGAARRGAAPPPAARTRSRPHARRPPRAQAAGGRSDRTPMAPRGRHPASSAGIAAAAVAAARRRRPRRRAADLPACPPGAAHDAWLAADVPAQVVFGRSVTVSASVRPGVTDARLELRTAAGTLLAVSTAVAPGPQAGVIRILGPPDAARRDAIADGPAQLHRAAGQRRLPRGRFADDPPGARPARAPADRPPPGRRRRSRSAPPPARAARTICARRGCRCGSPTSRRTPTGDADPGERPPVRRLAGDPRGRGPRAIAVVPADANLVLRPRAGARAPAPDDRPLGRAWRHAGSSSCAGRAPTSSPTTRGGAPDGRLRRRRGGAAARRARCAGARRARRPSCSARSGTAAGSCWP